MQFCNFARGRYHLVNENTRPHGTKAKKNREELKTNWARCGAKHRCVQKSFREAELFNCSKYFSTVFWNKNQIDAQFTLVGINEIVDAVVMHKIAPKLNSLSAHLKTNEIKAEKFDSFVANEFLKSASDFLEWGTKICNYLHRKEKPTPTNQRGVDKLYRLLKRCAISIDY